MLIIVTCAHSTEKKTGNWSFSLKTNYFNRLNNPIKNSFKTRDRKFAAAYKTQIAKFLPCYKNETVLVGICLLVLCKVTTLMNASGMHG